MPGSTDTLQSQVIQSNNSTVIEPDIQHRTGPKRSQLDFLWPIRWCFSQVPLEESKHFCGIKVPEKFGLLHSSKLFFKLWELPVLVQPFFPWWHYRVLWLLWLSHSHSTWILMTSSMAGKAATVIPTLCLRQLNLLARLWVPTVEVVVWVFFEFNTLQSDVMWKTEIVPRERNLSPQHMYLNKMFLLVSWLELRRQCPVWERLPNTAPTVAKAASCCGNYPSNYN